MIRNRNFPHLRSGGVRHRSKAGTNKEPPVIKASVVLLGAIVLICVGLLGPPLWTAVLKVWQFNPGDQECSVFKDPLARETCNQEFKLRASRMPAKGN
jgi:hypothetical protein